MANTTKRDLTEELRKAEEQYHGSDATTALSGLTFGRYVDSARIIMFENHSVQRVVLNKTKFPRVFTNNENMVGELSSYVTKAKDNLKIVKFIHKFDQIDNLDQPCLIFVYNKDKNMYDVIERTQVQNLTEKYGFKYDNQVIDSLRPGDDVEKGTILAKPTSFDEFGNWGFGDNITFMYQIKDTIIEDAIEVSESLAKTMISTEVELVKVSINDNDILLNTYGVEQNEYKSFPDIGGSIANGSLCVRRRINNSQILFDLKSNNTRKVLGTDITSYINGEIVDIDIYCNKTRDEINTSEVNSQILDYLDMSDRYYNEIKQYTQELLESGITCSPNIKILNKRAKELTDKTYKIKDENGSVFNNMIIYFLVKREVGLDRGQKLTGRVGK